MSMMWDRHRADFVAAARAAIGQPYIWGGNGPYGYDCSGVILHCLRRAGYPSIRDMRAIDIAVQFDKFKVDTFAPGVLVFYGAPINHVMAVLGLWNNGTAVMFGAVHGDSKVTDDERAYAKGAMVTAVAGPYWSKRHTMMVDPFREVPND